MKTTILFLSVSILLSIGACRSKPATSNEVVPGNDSTTLEAGFTPFDITEYTVYKSSETITDDAGFFEERVIDSPEEEYNETEGLGIKPDSCFTIGVSAEDTVGLFGNLKPGIEWLCISLPRYGERGPDNYLNIQTGTTTASYQEDWLGDPYTVLSGIRKNSTLCFDIAFKECRAADFQLLEQTVVNDAKVQKRINDQISTSIRKGDILSYRNPTDTMRLRTLHTISLGKRQLLIANYTSVEGRDFVYVIENNDIQALDEINSFYSEVYFYKLKGKVYMHHSQSSYASHYVGIEEIDPETANQYRPVFKFSKSTD